MKKYMMMLMAVLLVGGLLLGNAAIAKAAQEELQLLYDDRKDLGQLLGVTVESVTISNETVTSFAVGTQTPDAHVLHYQDGVLYAVGTGTATLTVNGTEYAVTVNAAPISLFLICGHSVAIGEQGNAAQSVAMEPGQAYSSHRYWTFENVEGEGKDLVIVPSEVTETTGLGYAAEHRLSGIDAFAAGGGGTIGEGSALAWRWNQMTGEKVWVINAARGGSCLNHWIPDAEGPVPGSSNRFYGYFQYLYNSARDAYQNAQGILKNEIAAGHYTLSHMAMFYHNGANFSNFSGWNYSKLEDYYNQMWNGFQTDLATDMNGDGQVETLESMGLVPHWFSSADLSYATDKSAAFYMAASNQYPDVYLATDYTWYYRTDADLANFPDILYTTQSEPVSKPESLLSTINGGSSDNSFFCYNDKGHLSQVTYNLQGIHLAEGLYAHMFETPEQVTGQFYDYNANLMPDTYTMAAGESVLVVPRMEPVWYNDLTLTATGAIRLDYPGMVVAQASGNGELTLSNGDQVLDTITFTITDGHSHCSCVNADALPQGHVCNDAQLWTPVVPNASNAVVINEDGHYVLNWVGKKAASIQVEDGVDAVVCLNGVTLYAKQTIQLGISSSLTICDCSKDQQGMITVSGGATGAPVWLNGIKTVTLMSGQIAGSANSREFPAVASTSSYSNFYMYGGKLTGGIASVNYDSTTADDVNRVENYGGTVQMVRGTFTMYGGTIEGGKSTTHGGAVGLGNHSTFTMYGGTIRGGESTTLGGSVGLVGSSVFTMYGGTIEGGSSKTYGAAVGMNSSDANIIVHDGTIYGGTAGSHGAGFGCGSGTVTIYGGTVYGGTAGTYGGTASVMNTTKFYIYGGKFTNGTAKNYTAGIYTNKNGITLGGNPEVEEIYLRNGAQLSISTEIPLTAAKSVGIALNDVTKTIGSANADYSTAFLSLVDGYGVAYDATANTLILTSHVAQVGTQTFATFAEALGAGNTVRLLQDVTNETPVQLAQDLYLDLNGCDLSGLDLNGYKLYAKDSATDKYSNTHAGTLSNVTGTPETLYEDGNRYLAVQTDGSYTFHRFYVGITKLTLQPSTTGFGYKAEFYGDDTVKALVKNYGFRLWIGDLAGVSRTKDGFANTMTLRLQNFDMDNFGTTPVNAQVFLTLTDGTVLSSSTHSYAMADMLKLMDQNLTAYTQQQILAVQAMCEQYPVTQRWELENLLGWKPE